MTDPASPWNPADHAADAAFVPAMGAPPRSSGGCSALHGPDGRVADHVRLRFSMRKP